MNEFKGGGECLVVAQLCAGEPSHLPRLNARVHEGVGGEEDEDAARDDAADVHCVDAREKAWEAHDASRHHRLQPLCL